MTTLMPTEHDCNHNFSMRTVPLGKETESHTTKGLLL